MRGSLTKEGKEALLAVLRRLSNSQDSGCLLFTSPYLTKRFNFRRGQITAWHTSNKERQTGNLGFALLHLGLTTSEDLLEAFLEQNSSKKHYCEVLCEQNKITVDDIQLAASCVASEEICEVYTWEEGNFEVLEQNFASTSALSRNYLRGLDILVPLGIVIQKIPVYLRSWEALIHKLDLQSVFVMNRQLVQQLQDYICSNIVYDTVESPGTTNIFDASISERLQKDLAFLNGRRALNEVICMISSDRMKFCQIVFDLWQKQFLRPLKVDELLEMARQSARVRNLDEARKNYQLALDHPQLTASQREEIERIMARLDTPTMVDPMQTDQTQVMPSVAVEIEIPGYELLEELGKGAMGKVFKARQIMLNHIVAIKIIPPCFVRQEMYSKRLVLEAKTMAQLQHPNIVSALDFGIQNEYYYIIMEYIEGGKNLLKLIEEKQQLSEAEVVDVGLVIAYVLQYIHKCHLVHRDIKPSNILIDQHGLFKLADLGLIKDTQAEMGLTMAGMALGTPAYMSPEQLNAQKDIDIRTDIFSLGATLLHALTGKSRFGEVPPAVIYYRITSGEGLDLKKMANISDGMTLVLLKMLQPDRGNRYASPDELIEDLQLVQAGQPPKYSADILSIHKSTIIKRRPMTPLGIPAVSKPKRFSLAYKIGLVIGLLLLCAIVGLGWYSLPDGKTPSPDTNQPAPEYQIYLDTLYLSNSPLFGKKQAQEFDAKKEIYLHFSIHATGTLPDKIPVIFKCQAPCIKPYEQDISLSFISQQFEGTMPLVLSSHEGGRYVLTATVQVQNLSISQQTIFVMKNIAPDLYYTGTNPQGYEEYLRVQDQMVMVLIPADEFLMGDIEETRTHEKPHRIVVDAFLIDKYEVSNRQYGQFLKWWSSATLPEKSQYDWPIPADSKLSWDGDHTPKYWLDTAYNSLDQPVVGVDWLDAYAYAQWANQSLPTPAQRFLPTEAQWEKAARWHSSQKRALLYPMGELDPQKANYIASGHRRPVAVTSYPQGVSPYGIYNMAGNVAEWCYDWYLPDYYTNCPHQNPVQEAMSAEGRVVRGGSFVSYGWDIYASRRSFSLPVAVSGEIGFRSCRQPRDQK